MQQGIFTLAVVLVISSLGWTQAPHKSHKHKRYKTTGDCVTDIPIHLGWCSRDHGFNEGAKCGVEALAGTVSDVPADADEQVLGNIWDRTAMMSVTKEAWRAGFTEAAANAAICCQIHNDGAHQCLSSHRDLVKQWLKDNS
jgi:hypothetical protein